jgi:chromodomain-helicase-DNA-binding protein 7
LKGVEEELTKECKSDADFL